jgi:magnesium transporter
MAHRKNRRRRRQRRGDAAAVGAVATSGLPVSTLRMLGCDGETCQETVVLRPEELTVAREKWPVVWIDVEGLNDAESIRMIGDVFQIGDLALEDATTPDERPKVEVFGHQVLVAVRMARFDGDVIVTDPTLFHEASS